MKCVLSGRVSMVYAYCLLVILVTIAVGCATVNPTGNSSGGGGGGGGGGPTGLVDGTNYVDTTNFILPLVITNSNFTTNAVTDGYEVTVTDEGFFTNIITNWLLVLSNGLTITNTNMYVSCSSNFFNSFTVIYTSIFSIADTTNNFGSPVVTNALTNKIGFVGKFWYTNIDNTGYFTNLVTNWAVTYSNGIMVSSNYSNSYTFTVDTNYTASTSNFGVRVGIELTNESANTVAVWQFNEGTGQTAADSSTNGRNLTLGFDGTIEAIDPVWTNEYTTGYSIGCYTNSLFFTSASSQYAWWSGNYAQGSAVTVGFWMRTTNNAGIIISAGASNYQVHLAGNNIWFTVGDNATYQAYGTSAANITNGKWHYISCTYPNNGPNNRIRIFVDGVQNQQAGAASLINMGNVTNIYIGGQPAFGSYFNGQIDSVRIQKVVDGNITTYFTAATN